jgi:hypothetical protein
MAGPGIRRCDSVCSPAGQARPARVSAEPAPRAAVLLTLGLLEQHTGTFVRARELLTQVTEIADGRTLLRGLVELAHMCYVFDDREGMAAAAERVGRAADPADPEQAMLTSYLSGASQVFAGRLEEGALQVARALGLLESEPSLRDDPGDRAVELGSGD